MISWLLSQMEPPMPKPPLSPLAEIERAPDLTNRIARIGACCFALDELDAGDVDANGDVIPYPKYRGV
jgi:hypothetical protein